MSPHYTAPPPLLIFFDMVPPARRFFRYPLTTISPPPPLPPVAPPSSPPRPPTHTGICCLPQTLTDNSLASDFAIHFSSTTTVLTNMITFIFCSANQHRLCMTCLRRLQYHHVGNYVTEFRFLIVYMTVVPCCRPEGRKTRFGTHAEDSSLRGVIVTNHLLLQTCG